MRTDQPTLPADRLPLPADDLLTIAWQRLGLQRFPTARGTLIAATLRLLEIADQIRAEIDGATIRWHRSLADLGVTAKRCAICPRYLAVGTTGRKRIYCTDRCKDNARRTSGPEVG